MLRNLKNGFNKPSTMDCKMGVRTYRERKTNDNEIQLEKDNSFDEVKDRGKMMYKKIKKDIGRFIVDENGKKGYTLAYMKMCDKLSTTSKFGFRILVRKR